MIIENDNIVAPNPSPPNTSQPSKSQFSKLMSLNEKQSSTISTMTLTSEDSDDYSLLVESPDISDSDYKTPHQSLITAYGLTNNQDIVTPTSVTQNTVETIKTHIDSKMKAFNSEIRSMISRIASTPAEQSYSSPFESSSPYSRINVTPPSRDLMHRLPLRTIDEMKVMENDLKTDPEVISAVVSIFNLYFKYFLWKAKYMNKNIDNLFRNICLILLEIILLQTNSPEYQIHFVTTDVDQRH